MTAEEDTAVVSGPCTAPRTEALTKFAFDQVITEDSRQGEVFSSLVESYVKDLITGRSSSILLFGPTG